MRLWSITYTGLNKKECVALVWTSDFQSSVDAANIFSARWRAAFPNFDPSPVTATDQDGHRPGDMELLPTYRLMRNAGNEVNK